MIAERMIKTGPVGFHKDRYRLVFPTGISREMDLTLDVAEHFALKHGYEIEKGPSR